MNSEQALHGLNCPNCGGMVPIPEGQRIVRCPYCDLRSWVRGERGVLRFQVPLKVDRKAASQAYQGFLRSNMAIARDAAQKSQLVEAFVVFLPFWTVWARVAAWAFGQKQVGSGDNKRYEAREVRVVQEMNWNGAACDVGEFGVTQVPDVEHSLQPFNPEELHQQGLVFEPVNSASEAREQAEEQFEAQARRKADLDRIGQFFFRVLRSRFSLVYHPLWVMRYLYRQRAFQVVVDGLSGKVLYGKAPGNTLYRALMLVLGMAVGAFIAVDGAALMLYLTGNSDDASGLLLAAGIAVIVGLGLMWTGYHKFRHGEQYEFRSSRAASEVGLIGNLAGAPLQSITQIRDLETLSKTAKDFEKWLDRLS